MNIRLKISVRKPDTSRGDDAAWTSRVDACFDDDALKQWAQDQVDKSFVGPGEVVDVEIVRTVL